MCNCLWRTAEPPHQLLLAPHLLKSGQQGAGKISLTHLNVRSAIIWLHRPMKQPNTIKHNRRQHCSFCERFQWHSSKYFCVPDVKTVFKHVLQLALWWFWWVSIKMAWMRPAGPQRKMRRPAQGPNYLTLQRFWEVRLASYMSYS